MEQALDISMYSLGLDDDTEDVPEPVYIRPDLRSQPPPERPKFGGFNGFGTNGGFNDFGTNVGFTGFGTKDPPQSPFAFFRGNGSITIDNRKGSSLQNAKGRVYSTTGIISSKTIDAHDNSFSNGETSFLNWTSVTSFRKSSFMLNDEETETKIRAPKGFVPPVRALSKIYEDDNQCAEEYAKIGDYDESLEVYGVENIRTIDSWEISKLPLLLLENIKRANYLYPRQVQRAGIPLINDRLDVLMVSETGSGKTLAFLIPIISKCMEEKAAGTYIPYTFSPFAIIICPTRELVHQTYEQAYKLIQGTGVTVAKLYGEYATYPNVAELSAGCDILITTPGRLNQFFKEVYIHVNLVRFVVFDEGDIMLSEDFMADIDPVIKSEIFPKRGLYQIVFVSATFDENLIYRATSYMRSGESASVFSKKCATNKLCVQEFQRVLKDDRFETLAHFLQEKLVEVGPDVSQFPRILIFVNSLSMCDELTARLKELRFPVECMSSNRTQDCRLAAFEGFRRGDKRYKILVSTDLCARGLDIKNVDLVLQYELPRNIGTYIYRVGRVGRIKEGHCLSYVEPQWNKHLVMEILQVLQVVHHPVSPVFDEIVDECKKNIERGDGDGFGSSNFTFFDETDD